MARKRLGEILIEAGLIDETGLRSALIDQRRYGGPLGRVLVDMKMVHEEDLVQALSKQLAVPLVDLDQIEIPQNVLDLVPADQAEAQAIIPFAQPMKFLDVAMSDPTNLTIVDELRTRTHLNVRTYLAGPKAIERALHRFYGRGIVNPRNVGRRGRDSMAMDANGISINGAMEVVGQFDEAAAPGGVGAGAGGGLRTSRTTTGSSPRVPGAPVAPPRPSMGTAPPPGAHAPHTGPSFADIATLQERIASLEALVRRDEDVLKKLLSLIIEKGIATREEVINRLK
jgi:hypothetical protein